MSSDSNNPTPSRPADPLTLITDAFSAAWRRTGWLLFTGPHASVGNAFKWGLLVLLAGALGSSGIRLPSPGGSGRSSGLPPQLDRLAMPVDWIQSHLWLVIGLSAAIGLVVALVFMYVASRFQFVFLNAVLSGEPRFKGVYGATRQIGLSFYLFRLIWMLVALVSIAPAVLIIVPVLLSAVENHNSFSIVAVIGAATVAFLWLLFIGLLGALFQWWLCDFVVPIAWRKQLNVIPAIRASWSLTRANFGTVLLFLVARIVIGVAQAVVSCCLTLLTLPLWCAAAVLTVAFALLLVIPIAGLIGIPLALMAFFVCLWIIATANAPIAIFNRAWSFAVVSGLDPSLRPDPPPALAPPQQPESSPSPDLAAGEYSESVDSNDSLPRNETAGGEPPESSLNET